MTSTNQLILNFITQFALNIDKSFTRVIKNESKKLLDLDNTKFSELTLNQKNRILKVFDNIFIRDSKLLHADIETLLTQTPTLNDFFEQMRLPKDDHFLLFWEHIQLVDKLHSDFSYENFSNLSIFLSNFGIFKIDSLNLDEVWIDANSLKNFDSREIAIVSLNIYFILSHLDILLHKSLFEEFEPICLGTLFQKKLNPKNFKFYEGSFQKTNKHKGTWTNPSRSLLTLIATFAAMKLDDCPPATSYGLSLANYLLEYTDTKDNFIKKANEGFPISYSDFIWLLSDDTDRKNFSKASFKKTSNFSAIELQQTERNGLPQLWVIYRFFQNDYENRPENEAFIHGIYYELWEIFATFYNNKAIKIPLETWPKDLKELAQPY